MKDTSRELTTHFDSIIVDTHNDTMMTVIDEETFLPIIDIGKITKNHIDIPKLKKGGIDIGFFAAFTEGYHNNIARSISRTLAIINALYWTEKNNLDDFKIASTVREIKEALESKKIVAVPTIEGGYSFDQKNALELLKQYSDIGVKAIAFNWNYSNELGEGAAKTYNDPQETPSPAGLTELGKQLAIEMNRLGMVIDVSHMSEKTFWDTIELSKSPIMATHSGAYALRAHRRNLKDDQLKALAKNGGTVGIVLSRGFLNEKPEDASLEDFVNHIDYVVDLIGIDHVGLGSDFDGTTIPADIKDSSEMIKITRELIKRGYKKEDIEKILGKNMLRVIKEVEDKADKDKIIDSKIAIIPELCMGEMLGEGHKLTAKLENISQEEIDKEKSNIIVDGISYKGVYDEESSTFSLNIDKELKEIFHIVTFEVFDKTGKQKRNTKIFYINN